MNISAEPTNPPAHLETDDKKDDGLVFDHVEAQKFETHGGRAAQAGIAAIEQNHLIPIDGEEAETSKWEKYSFMVFRMSVGGTAITSYGNAKNQAFINGAFPSGKLPFGGQEVPGKLGSMHRQPRRYALTLTDSS